ncbi:MAG: divalent-cation tolerance protein CutA [Caldimonas sp.]
MNIIAVVTTVGSLDEARRIARAVVERGLAACAQITEIESLYPWNGALQNDREHRLTLKTTGERYAAVEVVIRQLHSYDLPAIHAERLDQIYAPYADWVRSNSSGVNTGTKTALASIDGAGATVSP